MSKTERDQIRELEIERVKETVSERESERERGRLREGACKKERV